MNRKAVCIRAFLLDNNKQYLILNIILILYSYNLVVSISIRVVTDGGKVSFTRFYSECTVIS